MPGITVNSALKKRMFTKMGYTMLMAVFIPAAGIYRNTTVCNIRRRRMMYQPESVIVFESV
jgi:hypothetical protein